MPSNKQIIGQINWAVAMVSHAAIWIGNEDLHGVLIVGTGSKAKVNDDLGHHLVRQGHIAPITAQDNLLTRTRVRMKS